MECLLCVGYDNTYIGVVTKGTWGSADERGKGKWELEGGGHWREKTGGRG